MSYESSAGRSRPKRHHWKDGRSEKERLRHRIVAKVRVGHCLWELKLNKISDSIQRLINE